MLYDFLRLIPDAEIHGIDISEYAIKNSKKEVKNNLVLGNATKLPWPDNYFDLVVSITTLHNLKAYDLEQAQKEWRG